MSVIMCQASRRGRTCSFADFQAEAELLRLSQSFESQVHLHTLHPVP